MKMVVRFPNLLPLRMRRRSPLRWIWWRYRRANGTRDGAIAVTQGQRRRTGALELRMGQRRRGGGRPHGAFGGHLPRLPSRMRTIALSPKQ